MGKSGKIAVTLYVKVVQLPNWRTKEGMNINISLLSKMKEPEFCWIEMFNVMEARRPFLIVVEKEGSILDNEQSCPRQ